MSPQMVCQYCGKLGGFAALTKILVAGLFILLVVPVAPVRADTTVCGPITVDTTWTPAGNNYIVTCLVQVMQDVTLTIEPGVRVYFDPGTSLRVDGELIAQGVTFGSTEPTPEPGDWARIFFMATSQDAVFDSSGHYMSGSLLQDCLMVYGGGGFEGTVITYGASPFISGCSIGLGAGYGIYAQGRSASQRVVLQDNFVMDNTGGGIYVSAGEVLSNTVQNNSGRGVYAVDSNLLNNTITGNTGGGVYADGGNVTGNTVTGNSAAISGGGILAIGATLQENDVSGNSLHPENWEYVCGGGIYASATTLSGNIVDGNQVNGGFFNPDTGGAGVCAYLSDLTNNVITNNTVAIATDNAYGGGIYSEGSEVSQNLVSGNSVTGNIGGYGGGIYAKGGTVSGNTISRNVAAGGSVSRGGGVYGHISTLQANTLTRNNANQGGAAYAYKGSITDSTALTNTTSLSGTLYIDQGTATLNVLKANSAVAGGGIYGTNATLTGNTAEKNIANYGAGIYAMDSAVLGNRLSGNDASSDGGGLYASGGRINNNSLTGNTVPSWGHGSGAYILGVTDFAYNDVLTNTAPGGTSGGVSISGQPVLQYNNLYGNTPYDAEVVTSQDVDGIRNYWGRLACTAIPGRIYDGYDAPPRGILYYAPSLYSPVPVAQLDAPTDLEIDIGDAAVTLSWTPIAPIPEVGCRPPGFSDPDLVYHIWYSVGKPCGPYDGTGLPAGDSPIDAGEATSYVVNGLGPGDYYFVVAAHDYLERESSFSNNVRRPPTGYWVYLPIVIR